MTNFKQLISYSAIFSILFVVTLFAFNTNANAQKSKTNSKTKNASKSVAAKKTPLDLKLAPVILIHGIGGSDLD